MNNYDPVKGVEHVLVGKGAKDHPEYAMTDFAHYSKEVEQVEDFLEWKDKVEAYCVADCVSLYQLLIKFNHLVYGNWKINITKFPTTTALAFAIFTSAYYSKSQYKIPITEGEVYKFIKQSFTGGSTEMYAPKVQPSGPVWVYDVNSLYPSVMKDFEYPCGDIMKFVGDPTILCTPNSKYYFIADAFVETIKDLHKPYLQIHHKIGNSTRTVAANGKFNMVINSPEYFNALDDYTINIKKGLIWGPYYCGLLFDFVVP